MGDVKLKISGDAEGLISSVKAAVAQGNEELKKLKVPADVARVSSKTPGVESVRDAAQSSRAMDQKLKEEKAGLEIINKELSKKKALIDEIAKKQETAVKGSREELNLLQQKSRAEERLQQTQKIAQIQKTNYDRAKQVSDRAYGTSNQSPSPLGNGQGGKGVLGQFGFTGIVGGLTAAVVQGISQIAGSPSRTIVAGGSAVNNTVGRELSSLYNGSLPNNFAFTKERAEAKEMADKQEAANRASDATRTAAGMTLAAGAGATALGAGWTGVGMLGAAGAAAGSLGVLFGSERMRARTTSQLTKGIFPGYSNQQNEEYENLLAQQNSSDYSKNYEAKKQLNPLKVLAVDDYNKNSQRDLDFQRQMGLDTQGFRGKFKGSVFDAGFDDVQGMGMASNILGSGGSTRSATGNAALGLQAQRNLDITNSASILGKLSGSLGSADTTKESFVKILAEGTKIGLDGSQFREENRRFVESAAQAVAQSGTTTTGGVDQILSQFGRFFGDKTNAGMDAGKNAYDLYRQTSMETSGPIGTMRAAGMLTDPTIKKLSRDSREALFNMPIDELTSDNPAIIAMAAKAKVSPEELIKSQNKITANSANVRKNADDATKNLANFKNKNGMTSAIGYQGPFSPEIYAERTRLLGESNIQQSIQHPELGKKQRDASVYSDALSSGDARAMNKVLEDNKKGELAGTTTGRPEDETNKIRAEMSKQVNQIFMDMKDSIVPAAGAAANFVEQIKKLNAEMMSLPENQRATFANKNLLNLFGHAPTTVPSAGSPSSGGGSGQ